MGSGICCECRRSEAQRDPLLSGGRNSLGPRPQSDRNSLIPAVLDRTHPSHIENTWKKNIEATWALKASKTAASTDIPRLVRKFELIDQKGLNITPSTTAPATIPPRSDQKASPTLIDDPRTREDEIVVLNFLLALAAALKDEDTYKHLEAHFWDFFPRQEMSGPLKSWFVDVEDRFEEDPITLKVLKLANQRVMIPSFWCVKSMLGTNLMLDKRGSWRIEFRLRDDGIDVVHIKTHLLDERGRSPEVPEISTNPEVEFDLELVMKVDCATVDGDVLREIYIDVGNVLPADDNVEPTIVDYWRKRITALPRIE